MYVNAQKGPKSSLLAKSRPGGTASATLRNSLQCRNMAKSILMAYVLMDGVCLTWCLKNAHFKNIRRILKPDDIKRPETKVDT